MGVEVLVFPIIKGVDYLAEEAGGAIVKHFEGKPEDKKPKAEGDKQKREAPSEINY
jgi:hypothetical protein